MSQILWGWLARKWREKTDIHEKQCLVHNTPSGQHNSGNCKFAQLQYIQRVQGECGRGENSRTKSMNHSCKVKSKKCWRFQKDPVQVHALYSFHSQVRNWNASYVRIKLNVEVKEAFIINHTSLMSCHEQRNDTTISFKLWRYLR